MGTIQLHVSTIPPSLNALYVYTGHGAVYTTAGKKYIATTKSELIKQIPFKGLVFNVNTPHRLTLTFYFDVLTKGFPKTAEFRFRKKDVSNYIKLLEDIVSDCLGLNDMCFTEHTVRKRDSATHGKAGVDIHVEELDYTCI